MKVRVSQAQQTEILYQIEQLLTMHQEGLLGGEVMPEDANPGLPLGAWENYLYFTLPMALNYQRNSYKLWEAALQTYQDKETRKVFDPEKVSDFDEDQLKTYLLKYKLALQPNKHPATWRTLCETFQTLFAGDVRNLFAQCHWSVPEILHVVQKTHKKDFPYLSGSKICHYWLYVISTYTNAILTGKDHLSVAPDTHVVKASIRLGLISQEAMDRHHLQRLVNESWQEVLDGSGISLIDIHTPLWLWSRGGFKDII